LTPTLFLAVDGSPEFEATLRRLESRGATDLEAVAPAVSEILAGVRRGGEDAVRGYVERFERRTVGTLVIGAEGGAAALARLEPGQRAALELAAARVRRYHEHQLRAGEQSFRYEEDGVSLGLRVRPLARVGVYAPGGKARYPSSVLMAAIPAQVAGVGAIVLATPNPDDLMLAAAHLCGVSAILDAGGAHAIAALAYGIPLLPRVDKIVGPGSAYVACAKRLVFGDVAVDGIAGPSEILVIADEHADPTIIAADLLAQAEHDESAYPLLVCTSLDLARAVAERLSRQLQSMPRRTIIEASLQRGAALVVPSLERAAVLADTIAAEHVALHVRDAEALLARIVNAGAVLVGASTPVAAGDYLAGPSHVLPTGGCVRFGSPLGVYDFVARSSVLRYSAEALRRHAGPITTLARAEGLEAHARSVEARLDARLDASERPENEAKATTAGSPAEPGAGFLASSQDLALAVSNGESGP
jgi:histidinol dehydrogenase